MILRGCFLSTGNKDKLGTPANKGASIPGPARVKSTPGLSLAHALSTTEAMATSPNEEKRRQSTCGLLISLFIQDGVEKRIVVHFHLFVQFHGFLSGFQIGKQLVNGSGEVFALLC